MNPLREIGNIPLEGSFLLSVINLSISLLIYQFHNQLEGALVLQFYL